MLRARIDEELRSSWTLHVAVADQDGTIVGLMAIDMKQAVLDQLFVAPSAREKVSVEPSFTLPCRNYRTGSHFACRQPT
jgi:hypothetical protein